VRTGPLARPDGETTSVQTISCYETLRKSQGKNLPGVLVAQPGPAACGEGLGGAVSAREEIKNGGRRRVTACATKALHETIKDFVQSSDHAARRMIQLTWANAVLTVMMLVAVVTQIVIAWP
jgi:hypothetical protein